MDEILIVIRKNQIHFQAEDIGFPENKKGYINTLKEAIQVLENATEEATTRIRHELIIKK